MSAPRPLLCATALLLACSGGAPRGATLVRTEADPPVALPSAARVHDSSELAAVAVRNDDVVARRTLHDLLVIVGAREEAAFDALVHERVMRIRGGTADRTTLRHALFAAAEAERLSAPLTAETFFDMQEVRASRVSEQRSRFGELTRLAATDVVVAVRLTPRGVALFRGWHHGGTFEIVLRITSEPRIVGVW